MLAQEDMSAGLFWVVYISGSLFGDTFSSSNIVQPRIGTCNSMEISAKEPGWEMELGVWQDVEVTTGTARFW